MYIKDVDLKLKDWAFAQRKYLPWQAKLNLTETRIRDWADHWNGNVYVSFSGGLDSTVLLHFARKVLGNDVPAVFADTGLEFPELKKFVENTPNAVIIKPDMNFRNVISKYGYPLISKETAAKIRKLKHGNLSPKYRNYLLHGDERGKLGKLADKWKFLIDAPFDVSEKCCDVMKKKPFKQYFKETGRYPFIGITQDEGYMRERQYERTGCNVFDMKDPISKPLGFWTRQDVLKYIVENELEIASVYGDIVYQNGMYRTTKEQRTGCVFCAFGCQCEHEPNRFQKLEATHPKLHEYCMREWNKGGLGMAEILNYIGIPYSRQIPGQISMDEVMKVI